MHVHMSKLEGVQNVNHVAPLRRVFKSKPHLHRARDIRIFRQHLGNPGGLIPVCEESGSPPLAGLQRKRTAHVEVNATRTLPVEAGEQDVEFLHVTEYHLRLEVEAVIERRGKVSQVLTAQFAVLTSDERREIPVVATIGQVMEMPPGGIGVSLDGCYVYLCHSIVLLKTVCRFSCRGGT